MTGRYEGKPFLKLLDSYVLWSIGHLDDASAAGLERLEPRLHELYGQDGPWQEIVAGQMGFPHILPATINAIWEDVATKARAQGQTPDPLTFTLWFVDTNFAT